MQVNDLHFVMTYPSIWLDLPVIGSFAALTYYLKLYEQENACEMLSFFATSIVIILMFLYSLVENCIIAVLNTNNDAVIFTVNESDQEEQDGTPLPPDSKSGILVDTNQVWMPIINVFASNVEQPSVFEKGISADSGYMVYGFFDSCPVYVQGYSTLQIWSNVYGLGLASFFMLYSIQSTNTLGNVVMCTTFLGISCLEFFKQDISKQWDENPLASRLSLLLKGLKSNYRVFCIMPILLLIYMICACLLLAHALQVFYALAPPVHPISCIRVLTWTHSP
jgi:hypothetical protein